MLVEPGSPPFWLMARRQTAGRGRQGRLWIDPVGNFAATYCTTEPLPPTEAGLRSFVAALALHDALAGATGKGDLLTLKWPNDVLLKEGKLAGILLESSGQGGTVARLCIGIGVNLLVAPDPTSLPEDAQNPVSLKAQTGVELAPEDLLDRLAPAYAHWDARLRAEGFAPIRDAWLARAGRLGERVEVKTGPATRTGVFEGIDDAGALILRDGLMRHLLPAGDVHFLN